jgi:hypothetical protein
MNDLPRTEEALKRHMVGMQYPFGLLITPEKKRDPRATLLSRLAQVASILF